MKLILLVFVSITVTSLPEFGHACSCFPGHPQVQVCAGQTVVEYKVLSETLIPFGGPFPFEGIDRVIYKARVTKVLKKKPKVFRRREIIQITTAGDGGRCGVRLTVGASYIQPGTVRIENGLKTLSTSLCSFRAAGTKSNRKNIQRFLANCDCANEIEVCFRNEPCAGNKLCKAQLGNKGFCYIDFSVCQKAKKGWKKNRKCQWSDSKALRNCLRQP